MSNLSLDEEQQQRLYKGLTALVKVDQRWFRWRDGKLKRMLSGIAGSDLDDTLPVLADLCDDAGLPEFVVRLLRERTRWVYALLCEYLKQE